MLWRHEHTNEWAAGPPPLPNAMAPAVGAGAVLASRVPATCLSRVTPERSRGSMPEQAGDRARSLGLAGPWP